MCFICVQINKENITVPKAKEMLEEVSNTLDAEHYAEVSTKIWEKSRKARLSKPSSNVCSDPNFAIVDENDFSFDWSFSNDPFEFYDED